MNIKQAEELSGVSRQNIRFYEKQGLLTPARNPDNDYRTYSQADIERLKWIRALRTLDMPLEEVKKVLLGGMSLAQAAADQQKRLEAQTKKLEAAIRLCGVLQSTPMDVDACLADMEAEPAGYFRQWRLDYLAVSRAEHKRVFTFTPEEGITNPREFTAALLAFAEKEGLDLVVTGESMYPTFTIDGIEYTAWRDYHRVGGGGLSVPVATVHCEMTHPEDYLPPVPEKRRRALAVLNACWPGVLLLALFLMSRDRGYLFESWQGLVLLLAIVVLTGAGCYLGWRFHWNERGK
ncbi:MAG: MerR family transcriptional regulator [Eubacteriales bacterium]|nr:MerR family transcriptional regulator [Eubacteriales bacterium]